MIITGIGGSLRRGSFNTALLRAAIKLAPEGVTIREASIAGIPLYDGDAEAASGIPAPVAALKDQIAQSDGLIIATPEYNNSIPGVMKNAIDWASRPPADIARVFGGRRVALMGASPGSFGTILSQNAWLPVLRTLGCDLWSGRMLVPSAEKAFDAQGELVDDAVCERLRKFVAGFVKFVDGRAGD